jgi:hypothetical protein
LATAGAAVKEQYQVTEEVSPLATLLRMLEILR